MKLSRNGREGSGVNVGYVLFAFVVGLGAAYFPTRQHYEIVGGKNLLINKDDNPDFVGFSLGGKTYTLIQSEHGSYTRVDLGEERLNEVIRETYSSLPSLEDSLDVDSLIDD
tara:strand:+ start:3496 stop:3831 length:336 start_codon:yes stop_codon:yes gene_type:complete